MPTKKKAVSGKKAAPKRKKARAKKPALKRALICANGVQCFWTTDGSILSNLLDLEKALFHMSEKVFKYHVTKEKNDFADWVKDVLADEDLAQALRGTKKPSTARTIVLRRLKFYEV